MKTYLGGSSVVRGARGKRVTCWATHDDAGVSSIEVIGPVKLGISRQESKRRDIDIFLGKVVLAEKRRKSMPVAPLSLVAEIAAAGGLDAWIIGNEARRSDYEKKCKIALGGKGKGRLSRGRR